MEKFWSSRIYEFNEIFPLLTDAKAKELSEPPAKLIYYDSQEGVSKIMAYCRTRHYPVVSRFAEVQDSSIVVAIGCARKVDQGNAVVSFGVWFGDESVYNTNGILPATLLPTVQAAELYAVTRALDTVRKCIHRSPVHGRLNQIIIITDSLYVKDSLSKDIWKWETNKYRSSHQSYIANTDELKGVHELIKDLEGDEVAVRFWKVDKKNNGDASGLAVDALMANLGNRKAAEAVEKPKKRESAPDVGLAEKSSEVLTRSV